MHGLRTGVAASCCAYDSRRCARRSPCIGLAACSPRALHWTTPAVSLTRHIHADQRASLSGNVASSTSYVRLTKSLRHRSRDGKPSRRRPTGLLADSVGDLTKSYLGQTLDADGAIAAPRLDHRRSDIGKLDGMPAPRGLEARIARCLACLHPAIKGLTRSICTAQNSSTNLDGHACPRRHHRLVSL